MGNVGATLPDGEFAVSLPFRSEAARTARTLVGRLLAAHHCPDRLVEDGRLVVHELVDQRDHARGSRPARGDRRRVPGARRARPDQRPGPGPDRDGGGSPRVYPQLGRSRPRDRGGPQRTVDGRPFRGDAGPGLVVPLTSGRVVGQAADGQHPSGDRALGGDEAQRRVLPSAVSWALAMTPTADEGSRSTSVRSTVRSRVRPSVSSLTRLRSWTVAPSSRSPWRTSRRESSAIS